MNNNQQSTPGNFNQGSAYPPYQQQWGQAIMSANPNQGQFNANMVVSNNDLLNATRQQGYYQGKAETTELFSAKIIELEREIANLKAENKMLNHKLNEVENLNPTEFQESKINTGNECQQGPDTKPKNSGKLVENRKVSENFEPGKRTSNKKPINKRWIIDFNSPAIYSLELFRMEGVTDGRSSPRSKNTMFLVFILTSFLLIQPKETCLCARQPDLNKFCESDFVWRANISGVKGRRTGHYLYNITVIESYKGAPFHELFTPAHSCGKLLNTGDTLVSGQIINNIAITRYCDWSVDWSSMPAEFLSFLESMQDVGQCGSGASVGVEHAGQIRPDGTKKPR